MAQRRILLGTLPAFAAEDKREHDLLTPHAADLVPVEMPWSGTGRSPLMLFETPYRQLVPFSPFDPGIENANAIIAATSGTGKSVLIGKMLLTCARQNVQVSIIERGDSYRSVVEYMGGSMISMSLDSDHTINPFDLDPGDTKSTNDHLAFLKNLTRYMIGDHGGSDSDLLDNIILAAIRKTYARATMRLDNPIPTFSDLRDELQNYHDENRNEQVNREARLAATKLAIWVDEGMYAKLFDRPTTIRMDTAWLYFNIEQLKDDPRLETAMSLLIAYATTKRAQGNSGRRCITVLDECWSLLQSPSLAPVVVQLFRTARKRDACVWGISQAVEDFTGTPEKPNEFGGAILTTTAIKMIGRQKGNLEVLRQFLHLNETTINHIKHIGMTEKGKKSEFLICIGEKAETTHSFYIVPTPLEYWLLTTFPRERTYRTWWLAKQRDVPLSDRYKPLAAKYPHGISALDELPEERSGEVYSTPKPTTASATEMLAEVVAAAGLANRAPLCNEAHV
jgi:type IV secretory pathway VirB4 component